MPVSRIILALLTVLALQRCEKILDLYMPFAGPDPCDPTHSVYEGDKHFFHGDFIDEEDGTFNEKKWWFDAFLPENSPCDPLRSKKPLPPTEP